MKKMEKHIKNTFIEAHTAKIIVFLMFTLALLPSISAFEFDNVKNYDPETRTVDIRNSILGLPFLQLSKIAEIKLLTPTNYYVIRGKDRKVAEFEINNLGDTYDNAFKEMEFYNVKNSQEINRDFTYKYEAVTGTKKVAVYKEVCEEVIEKNLTAWDDCHNVVDSYIDVDVTEWQEFSLEQLPKGIIKIGIFTDVLFNDNVEWVPTLFGVRIEEWATWQDSYNVGLQGYYTLNDTGTAIAVDSINAYNGDIVGTVTQGAAGVIGTSFDFDGTDDYVNMGNNYDYGGSNFSVSFWVNFDSMADYEGLFGKYSSDEYAGWALRKWNDDTLQFCGGGCSTNHNMKSVEACSTGWNFIVITVEEDDIALKMYINGTEVTYIDSFSLGWGDLASNAWNFSIGIIYISLTLDGKMDEVGIWNRVLTDTEISDMWNGGTGMTYVPSPDITKPNIIIQVPLNTSYTTRQTELNYTATDDISLSACWYSNNSGVINSTPQTCNTNWSSLTHGQGSTTWTIYANDTSGNENSTSVTFYYTPPPPTVELISPVNDTNTTSSVDDFIFNITIPTGEDWNNYTFTVWDSSDTAVKERYVVNGTPDADCSETYQVNNIYVECIGQSISSDDSYHWNTYGCLFNGECAWNETNLTFTIDKTYPQINITYPTNNSYTDLITRINVTYVEENPSLCWYSNNSGVINSTQQSCDSNFTGLHYGQGSYTINTYMNDTFGFENHSESVTFYVDSLHPILNVTTPANYTNTTDTGINVNYTYIETNIDSCWWTEDRGVTNTSITCGNNITSETWVQGNNTIIIYMNDTLNNVNSTSVFFTIKPFIENSQAYNNSVYETAYERFEINMTYDSSNWDSISAELYYNGTAYTGTQEGTGDTINFTKTMDIPEIINDGNITFYWTIGLTNSSGINYYNSTSYQQTVTNSTFSFCNSTYPTPFINFTFKDETTLNYMTASIPTSTFVYYLGSGTVNKTLSFTDNVENSSFPFCFSHNTSVYVDYTISYKNSTAPQRTYNPSVITLSNETTNEILYLLSTADGIYVTFQVINVAEQPLSNVAVTANRTIGGTTETVGQGTTGADGGVTFWLNPDWLHTFVFIKTGYDTYTVSITPTQSIYTITLGGEAITVASDYTKGIKTYINPKANELFNDTSYTFSFNVTSSYWTLDSFGFNLRLANGTIVGSDSSVVEGTPAEVIYNVINQTIIYMDYYWIIEGNTTGGTRYWVITNTGYTSASIKNFFTDLKLYLDSGLFGLDDFGKYLIVFIILFVSVGIMSYKYGLTSPMSVTSMIFAIIFFFDIVVGIIPEIRGIDHVLTYLAGILLTGTIIMEVAR